MDKEQGNKLIAEFMGAYRLPDSPTGNTRYIIGEQNWDDFALRYHSSWDWLMPVVEKIQKLGHLVSINFYSEKEAGFPIECKIYNWGIGEPEQESEDGSPIKAVWQTVIEFIQYNNQTPKQ